jgi:hypothetical protein
MKPHLLLFSITGLIFSGCDQLNTPANKSSSTKGQTAKENRVPVHRFVLTRYDAGVAFDTQTGQLCRTWDWKLMGKAAKPDEQSGTVPQRSVGELTPTCLSLYQGYPSGVTTQSEALSDDQPPN